MLRWLTVSSLALLAIQAPSAVADDCASLIGTCEYYSCIDQERLSCGTEGYALGYGKVYCEKFTEMSFAPSRTPLEAELFPASGSAWRDGVRSCLQQELESYFVNTASPHCSELRTFAFDSHPGCYTAGPSFCELSPENVVRIGLTIQADLLTGESQRQIRDTASICVDQLQDRIDKESAPWIRWKLAEYQRIWQLVARDPLGIGRWLEQVRPR